MAYVISNAALGAGSQPINVVTTTQRHPLGTTVIAHDPTYGVGEFIYLQGVASTAVGSWVTFLEDDWSTALLAADAVGRVAVAMAATVAGTYGWYQTKGKAVGKALTGFLDNADVYATATAGSVDDAVVVGDLVQGARGASAVSGGLADFEVDRPFTNNGEFFDSTALTATTAELNVNAGVTAGTVTASKAVVVDANKDITAFRHVTVNTTRTATNVGTANTGTTAVEVGDAYNHTTILTVSTTLPAIAGGANLAVGKLLYTFPAGEIIIESAYMSMGITQTQGNINADTPDGGLGTVIGSGVVATLDGTATFENIITGQTFTNCTGTAAVKTAIPTANVPLVIAAAGAHTVYFNVADGWAASGDAAALLAGTVVLNWRFMA